ncbi:hypothetical protein ACOME3_008884 [Neoechinorhynchus agilis]
MGVEFQNISRKEDFDEIEREKGFTPIKYLKDKVSQIPFAILCSASVDVACNLVGRLMGLISFWVRFSEIKEGNIHDYILTQCGKCSQWEHVSYQCDREDKCLLCAGNHRKENCKNQKINVPTVEERTRPIRDSAPQRSNILNRQGIFRLQLRGITFLKREMGGLK